MIGFLEGALVGLIIGLAVGIRVGCGEIDLIEYNYKNIKF